MSDDPHILSAYDRDLEATLALVMQMGGLAEEGLLDAAQALADRDEERAHSVRTKDGVMDTLHARVDEACARLIAMRAPVADDLRVILSMMRIAAMLERSGDLAANIAKRAVLLAHMQPLGDTAQAVARLAKAVVVSLREALDAYSTRDAATAADIRNRDRDVDLLYAALFRDLLRTMMEDPRNITAAMHLHFVAKNIERVGDHATGIAEQTIYVATGALPEDERPKGDALAGAVEGTVE
ncbi:MAG: phosphate transport system regulatory protein PhoU [Rhodobacteraceae bacterium]|nr:phosphate transport system regulatory protein PhoU [Paracoccaceae bacterium]